MFMNHELIVSRFLFLFPPLVCKCTYLYMYRIDELTYLPCLVHTCIYIYIYIIIVSHENLILNKLEFGSSGFKFMFTTVKLQFNINIFNFEKLLCQYSISCS